jgi:hypothetical protein
MFVYQHLYNFKWHITGLRKQELGLDSTNFSLSPSIYQKKKENPKKFGSSLQHL